VEIKQDLININFTPKRSRNIQGLVIHSMWGTYAGSIAWFKNPSAQGSAHYCISENGEITQCVLDKDVAWHAGYYDEPIADWLKPNPNEVTIGIELEDKRDTNWQYPTLQRTAFIELVDFLCKKWTIPKDSEHILLHKGINPSRRSDPVGAFNINWVLEQVVLFGFDVTKQLPDNAWEILGYGSYPVIDRSWALDSLGEEFQALSDKFGKKDAECEEEKLKIAEEVAKWRGMYESSQNQVSIMAQEATERIKELQRLTDEKNSAVASKIDLQGVFDKLDGENTLLKEKISKLEDKNSEFVFVKAYTSETQK